MVDSERVASRLKIKISRFGQHQAHASKITKHGAADSVVVLGEHLGQPPLFPQGIDVHITLTEKIRP